MNNTPPYFIKQLNDLELEEDFGSYRLDVTGLAQDNEDTNDELQWFVTGENRSLINFTNENSTDQILEIRSVKDAYGEDWVKLWVQDTTGRNNFIDLIISVLPVNDLPYIDKSDLPTLLVNPEENYTLNLQPYVMDPDTEIDSINLNVAKEDKMYAKIKDFNLKLNFNGHEDFNKSYISLELTDGNEAGNKTVEQILVNLSNNHPPKAILDLPDIVLYKNEKLQKIIDLDYYFTDMDQNSSQLKFEYYCSHQFNIIINEDHTVDIFPNKDWIGTSRIIFRCIDSKGGFNEQIINISTYSYYLALEFKNLPDLQVHFDMDFKFNLTPYLQSDLPSNNLHFKFFEFINKNWIEQEGYNNLIFENNKFPLLRINYSKEYFGSTIPIFVSVSDGKLTKYQDFKIKVSNNIPPTIKKHFNDIVFDEDSSISSVFDLYDYFHDNENSNLNFTCISKNTILDLKETGLVDVSVKPDWFGTELVTIRAEDISGGISESSLNVKVEPINDPPIIEEIPYINITKGLVNSFEFSKYISDVDNNISELQIVVEGNYVTVAGNFLIFDYPADFIGEDEIILMVNDGELTNSLDIKVNVFNQAKDDNSDSIAITTWMCGIIIIILVVLILFLVITTMSYVNRLRHFKFTDIYLIYKDGLLIAHVAREKKIGYDSDIIGSMFTAIQDFIQESFSSPSTIKEKSKLKRLDFGDFQIVIDRGENLYIAAIFQGFPVRKMMLKITNLRKKIEKKYSDILPNWKGNMRQLKGTKTLLNELLYSSGPSANDKPSSDENSGIQGPNNEKNVDVIEEDLDDLKEPSNDIEKLDKDTEI
jgi:hypothetical protein